MLTPVSVTQASLAISAVGDLSVSTVITLVFVPTALSFVKAKRG